MLHKRAGPITKFYIIYYEMQIVNKCPIPFLYLMTLIVWQNCGARQSDSSIAMLFSAVVIHYPTSPLARRRFFIRLYYHTAYIPTESCVLYRR